MWNRTFCAFLSVGGSSVACMFESNSDPHAAPAAVDAITLATREENAAGARRLAAIGDLWALRAPDDDVEKRYWAIDGYSGLVVEVAAALGCPASGRRRRWTGR